MHYRKFWKIFPAFFLLITVTSIYSASSTNGVKQANRRAGHPENQAMDGLQLHTIVQGSDALEKPSGIITKFGYLNDGDTQPVEPTKTEPDENTYVILDHNPGGQVRALLHWAEMHHQKLMRDILMLELKVIKTKEIMNQQDLFQPVNHQSAKWSEQFKIRNRGACSSHSNMV